MSAELEMVRDAVSDASYGTAADLLRFARICPPDLPLASGAILAGKLAKAADGPAECARLIELLSDCVGQLATHLSDRLS